LLRLAAPLSGKKSTEVKDKVIALLTPIKDHVITMTFDNGKEFADHDGVSQAVDCKTYFAKPYHSWERGQNENVNGLLRQYFPKTMELLDISMSEIVKAVDKLNNRPRKCLGYKTPYEAFKNDTGVDVRNLMGYALMT
jgi:IS30 family transposase